MIRVTVEIVPFGSGKEQLLGVMNITNNGSHSDRPNFGNYDVEIFSSREADEFGKLVKVFDHDRELGFWPIIYRALDKMLKVK